ncbi:hypothetical protein SDC9_103517 [bioreactor metagenome]|uniref:Uncharacterized protein n=1 Tax=bioreactor metagenome TaxID=1076179 RepID=A0A645B0M2_9ZZZZ
MHVRIRRIVKLPRNDGTGRHFLQFLRFLNRARHTERAVGEHQFRAVSRKQLSALRAHGIRHGQYHAVAPRRRGGGKPDARVAAGRFNHGSAGLD